MGFSVVQHSVEQSVLQWCPVDQTDVVRVGMLVTSGAGGIKPFGTAVGFADLTSVTLAAASSVPFGVVVGINNRNPVHDATYNATFGTGVTTQAAQLAREWVGAYGPIQIGDPHLYALVHVITPSSVLRGPIYNASFGTAPTLQTDSDGTDTTGYTTAGAASAPDAASFLAGNSTIVFRTGANALMQRKGKNTTAGAPSVYTAFPYDVADGDVLVQVPIPIMGAAQIDIDAEGSFVNAAAAYGTNYYVVNVHTIDLTEAGKEHVIFNFLPQAFTFGAIAAS